VRIVSALVLLWAAYCQRLRLRKRLASLSERELRDIGLTAADRACAIDQPWWRALNLTRDRY
jgi:uncharacterized protein YjiS (DUF1127 family)